MTTFPSFGPRLRAGRLGFQGLESIGLVRVGETCADGKRLYAVDVCPFDGCPRASTPMALPWWEDVEVSIMLLTRINQLRTGEHENHLVTYYLDDAGRCVEVVVHEEKSQ